MAVQHQPESDRGSRRWRRRCALHPALAAAALLAPLGAQAQTTLPDINVIATSPLSGTRSPQRRAAPAAPSRPARATRAASAAPGRATAVRTAPAAPAPAIQSSVPADSSMIDRDKVPANTQVLTSADFSHDRSTSFLDGLSQSLPGVFIGDQSGNQFQRDVNYRGFVASPVQGTPQGLAVYQNGVRINESYGDVVNWDFIPEMSIRKLSLVPNNPIFGLNAIGGALTIEMKNGFTYQGKEIEAMAGAYGRRQAAAQAGYQDGNWSAYVNADAINDGWRDFSSSSQLRRIYADIGARNDTTEVHINFTGADNKLGSVAATPIEMLSQRWSSVYTWPQGTHLQLAFVNASANYAPSDTLSFQSNVYYRGFWQAHTDGNGTDAQPCDPTSALAGQLCMGDGMTPINVHYSVIDTLPGSAVLGEIDRNWTSTDSFGGTVQATSSSKFFDHDNHFVMGMSLDRGLTQFTGSSQLGTIDQNLFVQGTGVYIDQPADDIAPVNLFAKNTYTGLYATDTLDVTDKLSITAGARFNIAQIDLLDETGAEPLINSASHYQRLNPVIGATYKFTPFLTGYAGYSEANRAPTPLELGCSSPTNPCIIDNFLIADPPLKQVVSHTYEAGLRGNIGANPQTGQVNWALGTFYTLLWDDIINVAGSQPMTGYFQNAGNTLREGIEAKINYKWDHWTTYANYTYVDATYRRALLISSPNDPFADANGNIFVAPGDHIPGPAQRFKTGVEYAVADAWKFGADLNYVGTQWLIHDDNNLNPKVPAFATVNLHGSYQVTKNVELFGLVNNLFNNHYYAAGTFFQASGFNSNTYGAANFFVLNDPRTFLPGMPLAAYAGVRATF